MSKEFEKLPFFDVLKLNEDELKEYYALRRKKMYENKELFKGMLFRKTLHPLMWFLIYINRVLLLKQSISVLNKNRFNYNKNERIILAATHLGYYDYQIISEVYKHYQIPFSADPETLYRSFDGFMLDTNGVILSDVDVVDENGKHFDTHIAKETAIEFIKNGYNVYINPEGIWNTHPSNLCLPLYSGIINMAMEGKAKILPIAIEQYEKNFFVNFGNLISIREKDTFDKEEDIKQYINEQRLNLRDELATLKYEIISSQKVEKRENIGEYEEEYNQFVQRRLNEWINSKTGNSYYNEFVLNSRRYKENDAPEEVFSFLNNLKPCLNNAFLFSYDASLPNKTIKSKRRR